MEGKIFSQYSFSSEDLVHINMLRNYPDDMLEYQKINIQITHRE